MNIKIGQMIYNLRKQNNLTQEELSQLLNVSNAAVSKWESGASYPDIEILPQIAKIFRVSIDYLYGYEIKNDDLDEIVERAEDLRKIGKIGDAIKVLEDALMVYPNDLNLNLLLARNLTTKSLNQSPVDKEQAMLAIMYFDKALLLDKVGKNRESIIQNKSFILSSLGEFEKANNLLTELNFEKYKVQIANNLIKMNKYDEGMKILQQYLNSIAFDFAWLGGLLKKCFENFGLDKEGYDIIKMVANVREFMADSADPNYYNLLSSKDYLDLALEDYRLGNVDQMWTSLTKAVDHAVRFDLNPSYEVNKVNFMNGVEGSFYNGNVGASKYIIKKLKSDFDDFSKDSRYIDFIDKLESTKN